MFSLLVLVSRTPSENSTEGREYMLMIFYLVTGGENISSVALEGMLVTHPAILEAAVVAVSDSHWGERPKAYITVKNGQDLTEAKV